MRRKGIKRTREFWTRERVLLGLKRFFNDFGFTPTSSEEWQEHAEFSGRNPATGKWSNMAWHQKYPSTYAVLKHFRTFREAWIEAGYDVLKSYCEWEPIEDWFILESVGILPRSEVSKIVRRSVPAIKRRLYDLGDIRSYNRWGVTLTHAATLMKLNQSVFRKYMDLGVIPYLKGNKLFYLNPADLLKVEEFDWSGDVDTELEQLVRAAVAQRICKMLKFGAAWRDHEVYKFNKVKDRFQGRIKNPRKSILIQHVPPMPEGFEVGDWVTTTAKVRSMIHEVGTRVGKIETIWYSWQRVKRADGTRRGTWVARVEFPKIRTITGEKDRRIRYTIPLDALVHTDKLQPEARPSTATAESKKMRERFDRKRLETRERFRTEIQEQLT